MTLTNRLENAGTRFFYSPLAGFLFTNAWYSLVTRLDKNAEALVLNYGFVDPNADPIALDPRLEPHRFGLQLYHHVASRGALAGKDVLEIGCGRAGGASYLAATSDARRYVGLDINKHAVAFDRRHYAQQHNLEFVVGDAHAIRGCFLSSLGVSHGSFGRVG